jgi:hypothetical protein
MENRNSKVEVASNPQPETPNSKLARTDFSGTRGNVELRVSKPTTYEFALPDSSTFRPLTFNFLKNEATDLYENKGSALAKIRNEATVEGNRQGMRGRLLSLGLLTDPQGVQSRGRTAEELRGE